MPKYQPNAKRAKQTGGWRCCPECHARIEVNIPKAVKAGQPCLSKYAELKARIEPEQKQRLIDESKRQCVPLATLVRQIIRDWEARLAAGE